MMPAPRHDSVRYERKDVRVVGLLSFAIIFIIAAFIGHTLLFALMEWFNRDIKASQPAPLPVSAPTTPPEPRLEEYNGEALVHVRAAEDKHLNSYDWVDRKSGVIRMPIDAAMELYLKRAQESSANSRKEAPDATPATHP